MTEVFSCGGGTQSIAIAALIIQGRLPKPDYAVIVDTERERGTTWEYADAVLVPELAKVGVTLHRVRKSDFATTDIYSTNEAHIQLPMFSTSGGGQGKMSNFCSDEWKVRVLQRWLRSQGVKDDRRWIGFSIDEARRALRMMKGQDYQKGKIRFPLIDDVPMKRHHSIQLVRDMGWPEPPRSACWMCPNQDDNEWRDLRDNRPGEFAQAVQLEREVRERDPHAYLHRSCVPLDEVDFATEPGLFVADKCDSGMCFI